MLFTVVIAKLFPTLGKNGGMFRPELFIGNYGVTTIFFLSGLSLQTSDLTKAMSNVRLNTFIQALIFGFWPFCIGLPVSFLLKTVVPNHILPTPLVDGILIMTTLPTTVNMCIMLTSAGGGNVASSICNAVISNMAGILLTPLLLLHFFGATIQLPFGQMVLKLCQKVLLPVTAGQLLRTSNRAKELYQQRSKAFKRLQEVVLLGIVWNAFCNAFSDGLGIGLKESLFLLLVLPVLHVLTLATFFKFFSLPALQFTRGDTIAAMFCASQKTLAFGLPLVNTIFQGNPNLAAFCAPIMFIHPLQMTIGSFLLPAIQKYTERGNEEQHAKDF
jgi:sodium/bile acid cotransporter 7